MKAAIYARQSKGDDEGIERQTEKCRTLADLRGWQVVTEYIDNDVSASKSRGAATSWGRMLSDIEAGRVDLIIATKLDRVLRTIQDLGLLISLGVKLVTVDGDIDLTSAFGEFQATLAAGLARFEVRRKSERQIDANAKRARDGKWVGGRRPFGFDSDGMTIRPEEAVAIASAFESVLAGASLASVARSWNAQGFTTGQTRQARSGHAGEPSPWRADSVRSVLLNPRYQGLVRYKGEVMSEPAKWPAIVDETKFLAVQGVLNDPSRRTPGRGPSRLLTGLALCGVCGATVHAGQNSRPGVRSYRCSQSTGHFARMAEPVEEYVEAVTVSRLSRPDARGLLHKPSTVDTAALHQTAAGLRARLDSLAVEFADGIVTADQLRTVTGRIRDNLAGVESQLADAGRVDVLGSLVGAADVASAWASRGFDQKRLAIATLMRVTLHPPGRGTRTFRPETVGIEWLSEAK